MSALTPHKLLTETQIARFLAACRAHPRLHVHVLISHPNRAIMRKALDHAKHPEPHTHTLYLQQSHSQSHLNTSSPNSHFHKLLEVLEQIKTSELSERREMFIKAHDPLNTQFRIKLRTVAFDSWQVSFGMEWLYWAWWMQGWTEAFSCSLTFFKRIQQE